ncbi:chorismate-binding protein [Amycolatopsis jejuensis]|uniref:chorismate-binding protein n=1 Tax=Amycolatopsis jejuensis TaxID=330084 RepID=UPI0005262A63|nr:chorismate-binding protein [Amycolatopsis jejuensis]
MRGAGRWGGARFDDLQARTSLCFPVPARILRADRAADVLPVLAAVEEATARGSWAYGYVAYEAAAGLDRSLATHHAAGLPLAWFALTGAPSTGAPLETAVCGTYRSRWRPGWDRSGYRSRVQAVRARIAAGDTYQTNLTVRMRGRVEGDLFAFYRDLALAQHGAGNAYLELGRYVIASASPELFFERRADRVLLRPMKGTSRRGADAAEDRVRAHALRSDAKERAENIMIVDLIRNDIARLAIAGTVRVPSLLTVERFGTVLQLTSDVTATLRPGTGLTALFTALFPCGSVTGAPKVSTMALITELEDTPRGVYCGAIGWVAPPSQPVSMRFAVAIRTAVIDTHDGSAVYGTGSAITWSSDPDAEHDEILAKTAILRAGQRVRGSR